ncbi:MULTISPECIES: DUF1491 family protein [unclassified Rhizobium]|uniref:DUF1491 family protein n=1 Tax=unclassified Rhizobium TaxID=2613769 RepID=UPI00160D016A|nr:MULTISPECIES: DUF1491 family protein [unclassified Rhizobium]MBB3539779.1 hypothetical protein [Rhizobium sp. BK399]MCS3739212.1 hypothetical protein [Rhizobium sp. BK661]MCS4090463.1 hypothetical protein [Rhizobium sp. BK176]
MRLRTDIFVSALVRRVFGKGDFAAVEAKGADEAGAVFIRQHFRDGLETLYGPAPQSVFDDETSGERLFEQRLMRAEPDKVREMLERERKFDPDLWIVELEAEDLGDIVPLAGGRENPL